MKPRLTKTISQAEAAHFMATYRNCAASVAAMAVIIKRHPRAGDPPPDDLMSAALAIARLAGQLEVEASERWGA